MKTFHGTACAKLNLYLGVHDLRQDGYHELETVFQSIELRDLVSISLHNRGGISFRCNLPYLPRDGRNLAVKAAEAFFQAAGRENPGLLINVKKVIPVGAGMAGGSTDAACVLRLLNRAFGMPLSQRALARTALALGADVPFCLRGGAALAKGVGERLEPLRGMPPCWIVVGKPNFSVATKEAFALFDQWKPQLPASSEPVTEALENGDLADLGRNLYNSLEEPVAARRPLIGQLRELLLEQGALGARMTGSGSAVFGLFDKKETAARAAGAMAGLCREVFLTAPAAKRPPAREPGEQRERSSGYDLY